MRVYFEKPRTTVGWKGLINDPVPERQLPHQRGPAHRARLLVRINQAGVPAALRVPRRDHAAVHRRPRVAGARSARAPPRARCTASSPRASRPGRLQERHRRQREDRGRRDPRRAAEAPFPVGAQERPLGDRRDARQRGLPHHPARRQDAELRCGQRRGGVQRARERRAGRAPDDRLLARQQLEGAREPDRGVRATSRGRSRRRAAASSA